jgi:phosphoenolpyruvate synthase/pyruvate phosphate dikinase
LRVSSRALTDSLALPSYVAALETVSMRDVGRVGGKNASLAVAAFDSSGSLRCRRIRYRGIRVRGVPRSVLVASTTDPDWVPVMKLAAAVVTDHGGRTSHAAIVSRELGVPVIVGAGNAAVSAPCP